MASVAQLGYLGIGISDAKAWQGLATSILGLQVVPGEDAGTTYLRMDEYHHRLALQVNGRDDIEFVGWEVPNAETLQQITQQLRAGGVSVTPGPQEEADRRRVGALIKCVDPDGIPLEIYWGRPINPQRFHPARPMSGFKTGNMGFGHMLMFTRSLDAALHFYCVLLGFRVSDFTTLRTADGLLRLAFLHCNPRHHSLALLEAPAAPKRLNHVMFECNALDDVGTGRDLCLAQGIPIVIDLGRHMNDHMVSFYLASPSGFAVELGWDGRTIDDATWQIEHYETVESLWGHPQLRTLVNGPGPAN